MKRKLIHYENQSCVRQKCTLYIIIFILVGCIDSYMFDSNNNNSYKFRNIVDDVLFFFCWTNWSDLGKISRLLNDQDHYRALGGERKIMDKNLTERASSPPSEQRRLKGWAEEEACQGLASEVWETKSSREFSWVWSQKISCKQIGASKLFLPQHGWFPQKQNTQGPEKHGTFCIFLETTVEFWKDLSNFINV